MIGGVQTYSYLPSTSPNGSANKYSSVEKQDSNLDTQKSDSNSAASSRNEDKASKANKQELDQRDQRIITQLQQRDREVRAHEAAHLAAAGTLAISGANYSYQKGPDNVRYAVGGEVNINVSPIADDPKATLAKSEQIQTAALAPAQPSAQDISVASQAAQMGSEARMEIMSLRLNNQSDSPDSENSRRDAINNYQDNNKPPPQNNLSTYA